MGGQTPAEVGVDRALAAMLMGTSRLKVSRAKASRFGGITRDESDQGWRYWLEMAAHIIAHTLTCDQRYSSTFSQIGTL